MEQKMEAVILGLAMFMVYEALLFGQSNGQKLALAS